MNNLILGILVLYLIFIILHNSIEGFKLWQYYKYPYCGKCNVSNNEFDCKNCVIYDAVDGFKQNSNTYYKIIKGSKRQALKFCQKDTECKSIDYDNLNAKAYLSKKNIPQSCLLQQTTNKFTHFSKPSNLKNIQVNHKTITNINNLSNKSENLDQKQEQPNEQKQELFIAWPNIFGRFVLSLLPPHPKTTTKLSKYFSTVFKSTLKALLL